MDSASSGEPERTELTIAVRASEDASPRQYDLSCDPPRGTLPRPQRACELLARLGAEAFAAVPADSACTQIYGGPAVAEVGGYVGTVAVEARLSLADGCEIARWNRVRAVVPLPAGEE